MFPFHFPTPFPCPGGVTESHTPAHFSDELKGGSSNPTIASPMEKPRWVGLSVGKWPIIASPKEPAPASLGEGSVGVAQGDQAGGANIVAAATTASRGITSAIKVCVVCKSVHLLVLHICVLAGGGGVC
jgi:hypothetical protein